VKELLPIVLLVFSNLCFATTDIPAHELPLNTAVTIKELYNLNLGSRGHIRNGRATPYNPEYPPIGSSYCLAEQLQGYHHADWCTNTISVAALVNPPDKGPAIRIDLKDCYRVPTFSFECFSPSSKTIMLSDIKKIFGSILDIQAK
jgi:hypothetical protein